MKHIRTIAVIVSALIFAISFTQETFYINRVGEHDAFANGLLNLLAGLFSGNISWFANLLIIPAWILTQKRSFAPILLSFLAFILALSFLFNGNITANTAGGIEFVTKYLIGYWLWLLSIFSFMILHIIILIKEQKIDKVEDKNY